MTRSCRYRRRAVLLPVSGCAPVRQRGCLVPVALRGGGLDLASRGAPSRAASIAGGVALALASAVKLHPGTLVVWLAVRWHRGSEPRSGLATSIAAAVAAGAALLAASLIVGGIGPWRDYVDYLRRGAHADLASRVNIGPASILALLAGDSNLAHVLAVVSAVARSRRYRGRRAVRPRPIAEPNLGDRRLADRAASDLVPLPGRVDPHRSRGVVAQPRNARWPPRYQGVGGGPRRGRGRGVPPPRGGGGGGGGRFSPPPRGRALRAGPRAPPPRGPGGGARPPAAGRPGGGGPA